MIVISSLLETVQCEGSTVAHMQGAERRAAVFEGNEAILDSFADGSCRCLFWRERDCDELDLYLPGDYRLTTIAAGGWLIRAQANSEPSYWIPRLPDYRRIDTFGRILEEQACQLRGVSASSDGLRVSIAGREDMVLDLLVWEIGPSASGLLAELDRVETGEQQPTFLWGSHGVYRIPADLYRHLIHGSVFDLRFSWPYKRRAYSENEAHALHLTLHNRELQTGKTLYRYLRDQVLLSVLWRQDDDGAWRQGIWTEHMECHFRLHCSAMHMLMDRHCERPDAAVLSALERASSFIAAQSADVGGETWFLHDSLEQSEEEIQRNVRAWYRCPTSLKSPSNTLVLNTHIDTLIALHRFGSITGRKIFDDKLTSARRLLRSILEAKPAEWLYRTLFLAIYLNILPTERARALSLPKRALKRVARLWLVPLATALKCRAPRLIMPGGYLDRALSIRDFPDAYHSINFVDLVRYRRAFFSDPWLDEPIDGAISFTNHYGLLLSWAENPRKRYAIGFWVEGLYQLCLLRSDPLLRGMLAESAIFAERADLGLPPSLAGNNLELIPLQLRCPNPTPPASELRVINLSRDDRGEYLVINPGQQDVTADWEPAWQRCRCIAISGEHGVTAKLPRTIAAGGWMLLESSPTAENLWLPTAVNP